jgi:hypothetical protein
MVWVVVDLGELVELNIIEEADGDEILPLKEALRAVRSSYGLNADACPSLCPRCGDGLAQREAPRKTTRLFI